MWRGRRWRRRFAVALCAVAACVLPAATRAFCLSAPPGLLALQTLVYADPKAGLAASRAALAVRADTPRRAWLYAIESAAYSALELNSDERAAAEAGLALPLAPGDPARLALLVERAGSLADAVDIEPAIVAIDRARRLQPPASASNVCAMAAIGLLDHVTDHPERATPILVAAYRAADAAGLVEQRAAIASNFSAVLKRSGDLDAALALNAEEIAFTTARGLTYSLANAQYFRGQMLGERRDWGGALQAYRTDRGLSDRLHDEQGIGFADMGICEAMIELHRSAMAAPVCAAAARAFAVEGSKARQKVAWLQARIALDAGDPATAVALATTVLDRANVASASTVVTAAFATRAAAEAALGRFRAAYVDLEAAADRRAIAARVAHDRQLAVLRARFAFDAQLRRSTGLEHDLRLAAELSSRQRALIGLSLVATVAIIALLATIVITDRRHRRILTRLAGDDSLTGLPNRRRIGDIASAALVGRGTGPAATIALIDLDNFKSINDRFGHAAGDTVLRDFAATAATMLRATDTLGRWGGEEFLLVLPSTAPDAAEGIIARLRAAAAAMRFAFTDDLSVAFSAGVAVADGVTPLPRLIEAADAALYAAKAGGRDQTRFA